MNDSVSSTEPTLLSINNYFYRRAGAEGVFLDHNALLEEAGWRIVPFAMQHEKNLETEWSAFFPEEIEFGQPYSPWRKIRSGVKAVYSHEARRKIRELIDVARPNVCHGHNIYHHLSPSILKVIKSRGVPILLTLHDLKIACPAYKMLTHDGVCERCRGGRSYQVAMQRCIKDSFALSALIMLEAYLHRFLKSYDAVDRFVVPSQFYLRKLTEWGFAEDRFAYVPNFVEASALNPNTSPGERFLYLGRLGPEKGVGTLIRAAAKAGVGVDVAGTGPLRSELEAVARQVGGDVQFLGFLSGKDLHDVMRGARAIVLPSEWYENAPAIDPRGLCVRKARDRLVVWGTAGNGRRWRNRSHFRRRR